MFLQRRTPQLPTPEEALKGRPTPNSPSRPPTRSSATPGGPLPGGPGGRGLRPGLLLGRRAQVLADGRRLDDPGLLPGRLHREPRVRRGLLGPDRPHRGRPCRLRPEDRLVRRAAEALLGVPRPDPGLPPGQRRGHPVPLGDLHPLPRPGGGRGSLPRRLPEGPHGRFYHSTITTEILPAEGRTFWPAEGYHQQYLDKNPAGYCGIGGTGVSCPIGVAPAEG